jgi:hypothetical protein
MRSLAVLFVAAISLSGADQGLVNLLPAGAQVVAGIDYQRARTTPFGRFVVAELERSGHDFDQFVATTGFDPRRDILEVIFVSNTGGRGAPALIVARGNFDGTKLYGLAKQHGWAPIRHQDVDLLTKNRGAFAILDGGLAIAGNVGEVRAAIDRRTGTPGIEAATARRIDELSRQYDAWLFTTSPESLATAIPDAGTRRGIDVRALNAIQETSGGVKFGDTVEIAGEAVTRSEKDAAALADVVKFLSGMVRLNRDRPGASDMALLLDTLQLATDGSTLRFSLSVPEKELERIIRNGQSRRPRTAARR